MPVAVDINEGNSLSSSTEKHYIIYNTMIIFRFLFVTALTLFIVRGAVSLDGHSTGDDLVKAAYILFVVMVAIIIGNNVYLQFRKNKLVPVSVIVRSFHI